MVLQNFLKKGVKKSINNIKIILIVLLILFNLVFFHLLPETISKSISKLLLTQFMKLLNTDVKIHGNKSNLSHNNVIIMSNHYHGVIDCGILYSIYHNNNQINTLYTVVKSNIAGDETDKNILSNLFYFIKDYFMQSLHFIPYDRGNKEDGENVKNIINDYLNDNKNVLIFPEGTTTKNGIPKEFKTGIFRLAVENKLNILPITIKYDKDIGLEKNGPLENSKLFDNKANIYIHDMIDSKTSEYYKTNDYMGLKNKTYNDICSPFKVKENEEEKTSE